MTLLQASQLTTSGLTCRLSWVSAYRQTKASAYYWEASHIRTYRGHNIRTRINVWPSDNSVCYHSNYRRTSLGDYVVTVECHDPVSLSQVPWRTLVNNITWLPPRARTVSGWENNKHGVGCPLREILGLCCRKQKDTWDLVTETWHHLCIAHVCLATRDLLTLTPARLCSPLRSNR